MARLAHVLLLALPLWPPSSAVASPRAPTIEPARAEAVETGIGHESQRLPAGLRLLEVVEASAPLASRPEHRPTGPSPLRGAPGPPLVAGRPRPCPALPVLDAPVPSFCELQPYFATAPPLPRPLVAPGRSRV